MQEVIDHLVDLLDESLTIDNLHILVDDQHIKLFSRRILTKKGLGDVVKSRATVLKAAHISIVTSHAKHDLKRVEIEEVVVNANDFSLDHLFLSLLHDTDFCFGLLFLRLLRLQAPVIFIA